MIRHWIMILQTRIDRFRAAQNLTQMTSPFAAKGFCQRVQNTARDLPTASALLERYTSQMKVSGPLGSKNTKISFDYVSVPVALSLIWWQFFFSFLFVLFAFYWHVMLELCMYGNIELLRSLGSTLHLYKLYAKFNLMQHDGASDSICLH